MRTEVTDIDRPGKIRIWRAAELLSVSVETVRRWERAGVVSTERTDAGRAWARGKRSDIVAVVEVLSGPHRIVSLMTTEAVDELGLAPGSPAICVVKATSVIVEVPA